MIKTKDSVAAIVTCMTPSELEFILPTLTSIINQVDHVLLCISDTMCAAHTRALFRDSNTSFEIFQLPLCPPGIVRNNASNRVKQKWIAFCDGDDIWRPGKIAAQLQHLDRHQADFCGCDHVMIDASGKIRISGLGINISMPSSWCIRTSCMQQFPFTNAPIGSDGEWWVSTEGKIKKIRLPEPYLEYRVRNGGVSDSTKSKRRKLRLVKLAKIPVFGFFLRASTFCLWLYWRSDRYCWHRDWAKQN